MDDKTVLVTSYEEGLSRCVKDVTWHIDFNVNDVIKYSTYFGESDRTGYFDIRLDDPVTRTRDEIRNAERKRIEARNEEV